jgi:flavin-binding protein dodecin
MSVAKVLEVLAEGDTIEAAIDAAVEEVGESVRNVRSVYADSIQAVVEDGAVARYRVNCKVTFVVE